MEKDSNFHVQTIEINRLKKIQQKIQIFDTVKDDKRKN